MRGFPIVSIGTITSNSKRVELNNNNCDIESPQFELDEYFDGNKTQLDNFYKNKVYSDFVSKIDSITVYPNNLDSSYGIMSNTIASEGFRYYDCYSIAEKNQSIKYARLDCFYSTKIDRLFLAFPPRKGKNQIVENTYLNLPNLLKIDATCILQISTNMYNVYFNIPKCMTIDDYLFNTSRNINNLYFNAMENLSFGLDNFGGFRDYSISIHSTLNNVDSLVNKLSNSVNNSGNWPTSVSFSAGNICTLDVFDLRYWSKYENETGLDVGLLEGSNLR